MCGNTSSQDPDASFHRLPSDPKRRASWLKAFGVDGSQLKVQSRVCCRHFRDGDSKKEPLMSFRKRFAFPIKGKHAKAKRAKTRDSTKDLADLRSSRFPACLNRSVTPTENLVEKLVVSSYLLVLYSTCNYILPIYELVLSPASGNFQAPAETSSHHLNAGVTDYLAPQDIWYPHTKYPRIFGTP